MVQKNLFNGPSHDRPLDCAPRQYHFKTIHRPRTHYRNVDGLRTNDYIHREQSLRNCQKRAKDSTSCHKKTTTTSPLYHTLTSTAAPGSSSSTTPFVYPTKETRKQLPKNHPETLPGPPKSNGKPHQIWKKMEEYQIAS